MSGMIRLGNRDAVWICLAGKAIWTPQISAARAAGRPELVNC
jgi:hypothetical protein